MSTPTSGPVYTALSDLVRRGALSADPLQAQAAVVLERAARLEPGRGSILEALGRAYFNSGQIERARDTFEALLEVDPSSHYGHFALGQSLKRLDRPAEARTHLRLATALEPRSSLYRSALARLPVPEAAEDEAGEATVEDPAAGDTAGDTAGA